MISTVLSSKGQLIIPKEIREELHLRQGARFSVAVEEGRIVLQVMAASSPPDYRAWRGVLKSAGALDEHCREHADEVGRDRLS